MTMQSVLLFLSAVLQIGILSLLIYGILYFLRNTRGVLVLTGCVVIWLVFALLSVKMGLEEIRFILGIFGEALPLILVVLFQGEIRRMLSELGSYFVKRGALQKKVISELSEAAVYFSRRKIGALIVLERKMRLQNIIEDAVVLEAEVNAQLLESIFFPNSPLHDGAVVIRKDRVLAAGAILPLSRAKDLSPNLGTRHRAGLGITEESDAVVIVVSEETGGISLAFQGAFHRDLDRSALEKLLEQLINQNDTGEFSEEVKVLDAETESEGAQR